MLEISAEDSEAIVTNDGYTYHEGEYSVVEYVLDAKTLAIFSIKVKLVGKDGTESDYNTVSVEYNVSRPEQAQTMMEHAAATDNLRTVTIITDPDTKEEQSFSVQVPKGDAVRVVAPEEYKTLFKDRACSEPQTSMDYNVDGTAYMVKGK